MEVEGPSVLEEALWVLASNYQEQADVFKNSTKEVFPEMNCILWKCSRGRTNTQIHNADIRRVVQEFLQLAFDALDTLIYFAPSAEDMYPSACQFNLGLILSVNRFTARVESGFPMLSHCLRSALTEVNYQGSFMLVWKDILPGLLQNCSGNKRLLGFKLFRYMVLAAWKADFSGRYAKALRESFDVSLLRPPRFHLRDFRPTLVESPLEAGDFEKLARQLESEGSEGADACAVHVIPCGPVIDLNLHAHVAEEEQGHVCAVCQFKLEDKLSLALNACQHQFHLECLEQWANSRVNRVSCPCCRAEVCAPRQVRLEVKCRCVDKRK